MTDTTDMPPRRRQTKIVASLGPATAAPEAIRALVEAGVDVFRVNFSYGRVEEYGEWLRRVREVEAETGRPLGTIADLQGLKLRIGAFANGAIELRPGMKLRLDLDPAPGDETRVNLPHPEVVEALSPGADIVLDDGKVRLRVAEAGPGWAVAEVVAGTRLSDQKGLHVPNVVLPVSPLTRKDRRDIRLALDAGFDWIALSYVQRPQDVVEARRLIGARAGVVVKIESASALTCLDELIDLADAVMVARGDLGVELPPERVPSLQKRIVAQARAARKPVAITTQMLESMVAEPTPTRAEASDVATAIYDGADALVLSAETAAGAYPVETVQMMDRIARTVEEDPLYRTLIDANSPDGADSPPDAVVASAHRTAKTISAAFIATYTMAGNGSLRAARERPAMPIVALTANLPAARRLCLAYGVQPVHVAELHSTQDVVRKASEIAVARGFAANGEYMVITAGLPLGVAGTTNIMRIAWVDDGGSEG
jgi:pyruvate kinase